MWVFLEKHFEEVLTGVLVMFMASMVFFQVIMRYVFSLPTPGQTSWQFMPCFGRYISQSHGL